MKEIVGTILELMIRIIGIIGIFIILHEGWHAINHKENVTGICFGDCYAIEGKTIAAVSFNKEIIEKEYWTDETKANLFAGIITTIITTFVLYTDYSKIRQEKKEQTKTKKGLRGARKRKETTTSSLAKMLSQKGQNPNRNAPKVRSVIT